MKARKKEEKEKAVALLGQSPNKLLPGSNAPSEEAPAESKSSKLLQARLLAKSTTKKIDPETPERKQAMKALMDQLPAEVRHKLLENDGELLEDPDVKKE